MATLAGIVRTDIVHAILGLDETFDHSSAIFEVLYHSQLAVPIYIPPVQWWVGSYPHDSEIRVEVHVNAQLLPERGVGIYTLAEAIKVSG
jgi:hypothetical protein